MKKSVFKIGHLPILDHLILGVAQYNEGKYLQSLNLQTRLFPNWTSISQALVKSEISGAFLLFPLALDIFRREKNLKLILLGHREGQVLVVGNKIKNVEDLKGKTIFIPDKYSTHHILLYEILQKPGLDLAKDVRLKIGYEKITQVTDMLEKGDIDGFVIAEPIGTDAVKRGVGKILKLSHEIKSHHIDCVLVVKDDIFENHKEACQELVDSLVRAGMFVNAYPRQAAEIGEKFLQWPSKLLLQALTHDMGHILFWDLLPRMEDFEDLQTIAVENLKLWPESTDLNQFVYPGFAQRAYRDWTIDTRREIKDKGKNRTLPGNFSEAVSRLGEKLSGKISVAGKRQIKWGEKYPKNITRIQEIGSPDLKFLKRIFSGRENIVAKGNTEKGSIYFQPSRDIVPHRVLLQINANQLRQVSMALNYGKKSESAKQIKKKVLSKLLDSEETIAVFKQNKEFILSLEYKAFRFLVLLLEYYT